MLKLFLTILFFVSSLVGGFYVIHPLYNDYEVKKEEIKVLKEELENLVVYIRELKKTAKEIEENEEKIDAIKLAFPSDHDAPALFLYLNERIKTNNLKIENDFGDFSIRSYKKEDGSDHGRIKETVFNIALAGRYEDIKNFFQDTEKLMRIIKINNIAFSTSSFFGEREAGNTENLSVEFEASAYSY